MGSKMSVTEDGKEGKSKMIAPYGFLENDAKRRKGSQRPTAWTLWALT